MHDDRQKLKILKRRKIKFECIVRLEEVKAKGIFVYETYKSYK